MARRWRSWLLTLAALTMVPTPVLPTFAQEPPDSPQDTLSQLDNAYPPDQGNILSSRFEQVPASDKIAADDVLVPAGTDWWSITSMSFIGLICLDGNQGDRVQIAVYANSGDTGNGKPGTLWRQATATVAQGIDGNCAGQVTNAQYDLTPQSPIWLAPGQKFWLSIHSVAPGNDPFVRRLYWAGRSGIYAGTQPAFYYSGGSLPSCSQTWVERRVCDGTTAGDDMTWSITYTAFNPHFLYVPSVSKH